MLRSWHQDRKTRLYYTVIFNGNEAALGTIAQGRAGLPHYHAWAFASIRQAGAAFDLLAANLRWLAGFGRPHLIAAAESFDVIAEGNKALILKGARAVNSGRTFDAAPVFSGMAAAWDRGMSLMAEALAPAVR